MECPSFLPRELDYCKAISDETELFAALTKQMDNSILFFETACEDGRWSEEHHLFMKQMLRWITRQYALYKMPLLYAQKAAAAVQQHEAVLRPYLFFKSVLYYNVIFIVQDVPHWVNSLLFAAVCPFLRIIIQGQCWEKLKNSFVLPDISIFQFQLISQYIYAGRIEDLWRHEFKDVYQLMQRAILWEMPELAMQCSGVLKRYLEIGNVVELLLQAHRDRCLEWKHRCYQFFNKQNWGLQFLEKDEMDFAIEFMNFNSETIDLFRQFAPYVTHIAFKGALKERSVFNDLVNSCPKLKGLDLSKFDAFSDYLEYLPLNVFELIPAFGLDEAMQEKILRELPSYVADFLPIDLVELNLSDCAWLKPIYLKFILMFCAQLRKLSLADNVHLNYESWGYLNQLTKLKSLDLTHCKQLSDADLKAIVRACPFLDELFLEGCTNLTDLGVIDLIDRCPSLKNLNLNEMQITDKAMVAIGHRGLELVNLKIRGCEEVTEKGLAAIARGCPLLKLLDVRQCRISEKVIAMFQLRRPEVKML